MSEVQRVLWIERSVALARRGVEGGAGGPFGAVVVRDGEVIGEGHNEVLLRRDPTAHAEVVAIRAACTVLGTHDLSGCELFASCEPCPMCLAAALWARLERVYHAGTRQDAADAGFDDAAFYAEIARGAEHRRMPLVAMDRALAAPAFEAWRTKQDREPY